MQVQIKSITYSPLRIHPGGFLIPMLISVFFILLNAEITPGISLYQPETYIIWNQNAKGTDSLDQLSFFNALSTIGLVPAKISPDEIMKLQPNAGMLLVVPASAAWLIDENASSLIVGSVSNGMRLITDGQSLLAKKLGLVTSPSSKINYIRDHLYKSRTLRWPDKPETAGIEASSIKNAEVLYSDSISGKTVGIYKKLGKGSFIFLSALFDPLSGRGYSRFPTLTNTIINRMNVIPAFRRNGADVYMDPGYRWDFPIKKMAAMWKKWGIRAVHVSAWNWYNDPKYNYRQLINEAHKQGILIYAWLEWPYVGKKFWDEHPEWRQMTAAGKPAHLDFLYLMDLQNSSCMKAALGDLSSLLKEDWDGIDIAEFSITGGVAEALEGPNRPDYFTGFNETARKEFKSLYGFDQQDLFTESSAHFWQKDSSGLNKFYKYRVDVNNRLLRQIAGALDSLRKKENRDWEFIFTVLDNSLHPEFDQLLGFDLNHTISLAKKYNAILQVEDPLSEWTRPPERYKQLAGAYSNIVKKDAFAIDINVVPVHPPEQTGFASAQPTGTELFQQFAAADKACGRVCFYAESTIYSFDWNIMPFVMAANTSINGTAAALDISSAQTVHFTSDNKAGQPVLNGKPWPCFKGEDILLPAGRYKLSFNGIPAAEFIKVQDISGQLLNAEFTGNGTEIRYSSTSRCLVTLSRKPAGIIIDGTPADLKGVNKTNGFIIFAPSGSHTLLFENK